LKEDIHDIKGFQSLIGTIKTLHDDQKTEYYIVFQSLIGTIKTHKSFFVLEFFTIVSIPYRDDKNQKKQKKQKK